MLKVENIKSGVAFAGTPLVVTGLHIPGVDVDGTEYLQIRRGAEKWRFSLGGLEAMDIGEILESLAPALPDPEPGTACGLVADWSQLDGHLFALSVWNSSGDDSGDELELYAFRGGVSRQNVRRLLSEESDIFTYRLLNPKRNIFLTTRPGRNVTVKESEVFPLLFLIQGDDRTLRISERVSGTFIDCPLTTGGLYALDPAAARCAFVTQSGVLPSLLDVSLDGEKTTRIVIAAEDPEPERYRLKFRNSFGAFEIMSVYGPMTVTPEYGDGEGEYRRIDQDINDYIQGRLRVSVTEVLTVQTGWMARREIPFLLDLVGSEEVWLLDRGADPERVIPSISEVSYKERPEAPARFGLTLTPADSERFITPPISDDSGGIFTREFNPPFN